MDNIVTSPYLAVALAVAYFLVGVCMIVPPSRMGIETTGALDAVVAQEDDHSLIRIVKGALGINFVVASAMLVLPPIVIETNLQDTPLWFGGTGAAGMSFGPFIFIHDGLTEASRERVLRHEYQHYCQTAVLTPLGMNLAYSLSSLYRYNKHKDWYLAYYHNRFEIDARRKQNDGKQFSYFFVEVKDYGYWKPSLKVNCGE